MTKLIAATATATAAATAALVLSRALDATIAAALGNLDLTEGEIL